MAMYICVGTDFSFAARIWAHNDARNPTVHLRGRDRTFLVAKERRLTSIAVADPSSRQGDPNRIHLVRLKRDLVHTGCA
jgi:hypothetical protein